jgi:hypothetical protein
MFVMYFMGPAQPPCIPIVGFPEKLKTLVDKDIVYKEVSGSISHNTKTNGPTVPKPCSTAHYKKGHAYYGIKDKKGVISLKPGAMVLFMMILM